MNQKIYNNMTIIGEFTCEMTGDICLILRDKNGDEICISKEDYEYEKR